MRGALAVTAALAAAACASLGAPAAPSGPAFEAVHAVALLRFSERPSERGQRDPLDALRESLVQRGYATRVLEIGPGRAGGQDGARELERLYAALDARIASAPPRERFTSSVVEAGRDLGAIVAAQGVDAIATYHRFAPLPRAMLGDPLGGAGTPLGAYPGADPRALAAPFRRPLGAVALVDRAGNAVWYDWGSAADAPDASAPQNAAEAIDALVRVLSGEPPEEIDLDPATEDDAAR